MISLQNVSKDYRLEGRTVPAVCDASLEIAQGDFVIITGRSGSGKTTLLNLMAGLTRPTAGSVTLCDQPVWQWPDRAQAQARSRLIGFVFQFPSLMPSLSVLDNVLLPTAFSSPTQGNGQDAPLRGRVSKAAVAQAQSEARTRARELLAEVGLSDKIAAYPRQLSAGQQQRVVIARALINRPPILLADEPTSDLDEQTEQEIMALFREIHARTGVTVVMVTHSTELTRFGTRAVQMVGGRIAP